MVADPNYGDSSAPPQNDTSKPWCVSDGRGLVGARVGVEREVEELVLEGFFGWAFGEGLFLGGRGDDRYELELSDGGARDEQALGVGASVWWDEKEAGVFQSSVEEREVGWGEALELVAGPKGQTDPEAFGAGPSEEGAAGQALGVDGVGEVEVADEADVLDVIEGERQDSASEVEQLHSTGVHESSAGKVSGHGIAREAPNQDLFAGG